MLAASVQVLYKLEDPLAWRAHLTRMGVHAKFHRAELMRHMRCISDNNVRGA